MEINIDEIDPKKLQLGGHYYSVSDFIKRQLEEGEEITDDILTWIINPPAVWASANNEEFLEEMKKVAHEQYENKPKNLKIVRQLKKEFYEFMCTESKYYAKERAKIGGGINTVITSLAAIFATKIKGVEVGIITSLVTTFMIIVGKMGKRAMCESFKPNE